MNDTETQRAAALGHALRPDWPVTSLRTYLQKHHAWRPYRDVAVALAWVATDPKTTTPARLGEQGPWWKAAAVDSTDVLPQPRPFDPGIYANAHHRPADPDAAARHVAAARALLRGAS